MMKWAIFLAILSGRSLLADPIPAFVTYTIDTPSLNFRISVVSTAANGTVVGRNLQAFNLEYRPRTRDKMLISATGLALGRNGFTLTERDIENQSHPSNLIRTTDEFDGNFLEFFLNRTDLPFSRILLFTTLNRVAFLDNGFRETLPSIFRNLPKDVLFNEQHLMGRITIPARKTYSNQFIDTLRDTVVLQARKGKVSASVYFEQVEGQIALKQVYVYKNPSKEKRGPSIVKEVIETTNGAIILLDDGSKLSWTWDPKRPDVSLALDGQVFEEVELRSVNVLSTLRDKNLFAFSRQPFAFPNCQRQLEFAHRNAGVGVQNLLPAPAVEL